MKKLRFDWRLFLFFVSFFTSILLTLIWLNCAYEGKYELSKWVLACLGFSFVIFLLTKRRGLIIIRKFLETIGKMSDK